MGEEPAIPEHLDEDGVDLCSQHAGIVPGRHGGVESSADEQSRVNSDELQRARRAPKTPGPHARSRPRASRQRGIVPIDSELLAVRARRERRVGEPHRNGGSRWPE